MDYKDGDTITVNGKPCRIEGGALVPVVSKGPLGGELRRLGDCTENERIYISARASQNGTSITCDFPIDHNLLVETNIPPRPTFTPMSAGEAAALPDIVGRWVAVRVGSTEPGCGFGQPLKLSGQWVEKEEQILLIEGVDLP